MKLKNKKTGEIVEATDFNIMSDYNSLAELNEEWEDYEEPITYYYISDFGAIREGDVGKFVEDEIARKEIGNYFETPEEAEKAVEKLKAWKRLKDKGFKFERWQFVPNKSRIWMKGNLVMGIADELDILFGGEE